ncbi:H-2 class II histocompatibility antigen, A-U alpha chain-like isoform X1 [Myripristis murdjan]|uniref:H-2 class II histocompatibility antigen, A-U alpha chain-like n=3 Tax=Myripristis murdjan TaxID=586833 RepID=A0A667XGU6_9TELE|nr:H-2 class II histocompatibility antigen, A-U alpha chain-like isoform X1 [Myripristis murdjan]
MKLPAIIALLLNIVCASSQILHELVPFMGCTLNDTEAQITVDGEEIVYADFQRKELVFTVPTFMVDDPAALIESARLLHNTLRNKNLCAAAVAYLMQELHNPPEEEDPPNTAIYPSDEVELGVENSLICFVNYFYPPSIKVNWTKNGKRVSDEASLSRYYPNDDGTFHQFSILPFTPSEGDIYSCMVEHSALEEPEIKFWEPELNSPSLGPDIFCGVGLTVGMLGVAAGTFLIVKGHHRH